MLEISEPLTSAPSHLYVLDISILEWGGDRDGRGGPGGGGIGRGGGGPGGEWSGGGPSSASIVPWPGA